MKRTPLWLLPPAAAAAAFALPAFGYADVNVRWLLPYSQDDGFYNYDFKTINPSPFWVDMPIGMVWGCEGNDDDVNDYFETGLGPGYPDSGGTMFNYVWEQDFGPSPVWNADGGRQTNCYFQGSNGYKRHSRLYAPWDDYFYNTFWGYYIIASQHYDINHDGCGSGSERFGYSETVENIIVSEASADYRVTDPWWNMDNYGYFWMDSQHYHESDGMTAKVCFK